MNRMKVESIIAPVHKSLIKMELTEDRFLRNTNRGGCFRQKDFFSATG